MTARLSIGWLASLALTQAGAAAWVLSRQPTIVVSSPSGAHSHLGVSGPRYAPPISTERWPYLLGVAFLTAHVLFILVTACAYVLRRKETPSTGGKIVMAGLMSLAAAAVTPVVASISLGDQPASTVVAE